MANYLLAIVLAISLQGCTVTWWFEPKASIAPRTPMTDTIMFDFANPKEPTGYRVWYRLGDWSSDTGEPVDMKFSEEMWKWMTMYKQNETACHKSKLVD